MLTQMLILIGAVGSHFAWSALAPQNSIQIRVRIAEAARERSIQGSQILIESGVGIARTLISQSTGPGKWTIRCEGGKIAGKASHPVGAKGFVSDTPITLSTRDGFLKMDKKIYREFITLHPTARGCDWVNTLNIENYLEGIVNSEFSSKWNEEAIAAQVVAARTYAYYQHRSIGLMRHYDVDATTNDQVYDGAALVDSRAVHGVKRTRGVVLTTQDITGAVPIKAFYHSTCGGSTELPQEVWGRAFQGLNKRVACEFCQKSPAFNWGLDLSSQEIATILYRAGTNRKMGELGWHAGWERFIRSGKLVLFQSQDEKDSSRAESLTFGYQIAGRRMTFRFPATLFRSWVGPTKLRSLWFKVVARNDSLGTWKIEGRGNGHGVGLCQWGAKLMGDRGHRAREILSLYYPDAALKKLW